ncbi:MAG TPA: HEAT repeat domain-containing protein [Pyrinomonadaceae bacterium]|nr:HEAT repeat domain-containing protein [Pyrinomonadaceae bacterium]
MKALHNLAWDRRALRILNLALCGVAFCTTVAAQAAEERPVEDDWFTAYFVEGYGFLVLFVVGIVGLLVFRKLRSKPTADPFMAKARPRVKATQQSEQVDLEPRKAAPVAAAKEFETKVRATVSRESTPDHSESAFGAYRIDQEVGKLVLGKAHRMDVLASRVPEDRRAIEASLIKSLGSSDRDSRDRERARRALEDYGFVARQSALLLEGRDAWERSSAARVLGQIGSTSSLPALIEALHDGDSIVRNQAVTSLGQLKQPAAIGALLDVGRRYSDIPPSVLSESLSACSVEGLNFLDSTPFDLNNPMAGEGETEGLEPMPSWEQLPSGDEDDALLGLFTRLESSDAAERTQVARELGMHRAERSVAALCATASHDADAGVRSAAVTALGVIDHESVFAPVLIALADDTREVRAAAARALSGLRFDRAQAYTRVEKTADPELLHNFAQACVKTGIAAQAADRLASEDRRQAHEAYSLFSLLTKAGELQPVFDVIEKHADSRAKQAAVQMLSAFANADAVPKLRDAVGMPGMPEDVRTSLLEVLYKLDNTPAVV